MRPVAAALTLVLVSASGFAQADAGQIVINGTPGGGVAGVTCGPDGGCIY